MYKFKVGDRVFYRENGPEDKGTVIELVSVGHAVDFRVKWDNDSETDLYASAQLGLL